jgi:tRNA(Ile2) C34 agmatinyltransferase TiaS
MSEQEANWDDLFQRVRKTVQEWRDENPTATLTEIETAVDKELSVVRVEMIEELALQSRSKNLREIPRAERPKCPECGRSVVANGRQERTLTTNHDQRIHLERSKAYCRHCQVSFFPSG